MDESSEDNLTTRSLLRGILATENVRNAVKHQSKSREYQQPSTSYVYQDENSSVPSMTLRSKMKDRVRRSLRKSAVETSVLKINREPNSKTKPKSAKKGSHPIVEDLDQITPRTLLKKIIQNEDEVSIIVSQRSKAAAAADDDKQKNSPTAKLGSVSNVNLSLPDMQETEYVSVFRKVRTKRKMSVSEFEREVDQRLPKNKGNYNISQDIFDDTSLLVRSSTLSRSSENKLDISAAPESTFKRGLLRRPNKVCLVSLNDFEQGVEDKYQQLKGSQECFIEPAEEDKSDASSNEVAQMNTELYAQPLYKDANTSKLDRKQRGASKLFVSTFDDIKEVNDDILDTKSRKLSANSQPRLNAKSLEENTDKDIGEDHGEISDDSDDEGPGVESGEAGVESGEGEAGVESGEGEAGVESGEGEAGVDSGEEEAGVDSGEEEAGVDSGEEEAGVDSGEEEAGVDSGEEEAGVDSGEEKDGVDGGEAGVDSDEGAGVDSGEEGAGVHSGEAVVDSGGVDALVDSGEEGAGVDSGDAVVDSGEVEALVDSGEGEAGMGNDLKAVKSNIQLNQSNLTNRNRKSTGFKEYSHSMQQTRLTKENSMHTPGSVRAHAISVSRQDESLESSESSDDENMDLAESALDHAVTKKKKNNQLIFSASTETPAYIKFARFTSTDKPVISKKIPRTKSTKARKPSSGFSSSHVKKIFCHHAQVRVSRDAMTDVEKCLDLHLNQLAADLSTYTAHANRKTITRADLELLMKRQRLVTDTTSLNVLIEKHLPLEYRMLLIPCAMGGNKVFPKK